MANPKILIVEDNEMIRECVAQHFREDGFDVHEAGSLAEARKILEKIETDALVLDYELPDGCGLELIHAVMSYQPVVISITAHLNIPPSEAYNKLAHVFFRKPFATSDCVAAVKRHLLNHRQNHKKPPPGLQRLTQRERQILFLINDGHSSDEIAKQLTISVQTVSAHRKAIRTKFGGLSFMAICKSIEGHRR